MASGKISVDVPNLGYVEVIPDGVKTFAQMLTELMALIDVDKISSNAKMLLDTSSNRHDIAVVDGTVKAGGSWYINAHMGDTGTCGTTFMQLGPTSLVYSVTVAANGTVTRTNSSSYVLPNGKPMRFYY